MNMPEQAADIYLLDDVLAAVDGPVAAWLIDHVILGPLIAGKTRVIVTQSDRCLAAADQVFCLHGGRMVAPPPGPSWRTGLDVGPSDAEPAPQCHGFKSALTSSLAQRQHSHLSASTSYVRPGCLSHVLFSGDCCNALCGVHTCLCCLSMPASKICSTAGHNRWLVASEFTQLLRGIIITCTHEVRL